MISLGKVITQNNKMGNSEAEDRATAELKKTIKTKNYEPRKKQRAYQYAE